MLFHPECMPTSHPTLLGLAPESLCAWEVALAGKLPVLLQGPTGSGKSRLAEEIHHFSPWRSGPWICVNLASLAIGVFESELFGHQKGAFTGALVSRPGRLEQATGGTLFLDEVGELNLQQQSRLLEVLQTRQYFPVGGDLPKSLSAQIIVATHRDLEKEVAAGRFREDLFHRLRGVELRLLPLRELTQRWDEIIHGCLDLVCRELGKSVTTLSASVASALEFYAWPGNWRELKHALEYAVLSCRDGKIQVSDLPPWLRNQLQKRDLQSEQDESLDPNWNLGVIHLPCDVNYDRAFTRFERKFMERALRRFDGKINETARSIGMSKNALLRRIHRYDLRQFSREKTEFLERSQAQIGLCSTPSGD